MRFIAEGMSAWWYVGAACWLLLIGFSAGVVLTAHVRDRRR